MKPERNPAYLKFVRSLPCSVCGKKYGIEACHTGPHGLGQKSPDETAIPLCEDEHRGPQGLDRIGRAAFEDLHGVSVSKLVALTQRRAAACGVLGKVIEIRKPVTRETRKVLGSRLARR